MRTASPLDRSLVVLATAGGLFWRIAAFCFFFGLAVVVLYLFITYWWVVLSVLLGLAIFWFVKNWIEVGQEMKHERGLRP